jgi:hypothetical protein
MKSAVVLVLVALAALLPLSADSHRAKAQSSTSLEELRFIVDSLFAGDPARIEPLGRFTQTACALNPLGIGAPPECPEGIPEGALIDVYPTGTCHGGYAHAASWPGAAATLATPGPHVVAVFEYGVSESSDAFFYGDFVILATIAFGSPENVGGIFVGDGGITGIHVGCGMTVDEFAEAYNLGPQLGADALSPPLVPALAPSTGGGSSGPAALVTLAVALGLIAATLVGVALARRHS